MYWLGLLISLCALNKYGKSICNKVETPTVSFGGPSSTTVTWYVPKPIGVCERGRFFDAYGSGKFMCSADGESVFFKAYNESSTCSDSTLAINTYPVNASSFECGANAVCTYASIIVYWPLNYTNGAPSNCDHSDLQLENMVVTDSCYANNGNYSKVTCNEQGDAVTMQTYENVDCLGAITHSQVVISGCNANQKYFHYEINCNGTMATSEPSTREPSTREPSTREPSTREPSTREPSTREPSTREPSTREPSTREPSTREPTTREPTTREPTTREPTTREPSAAPTPPTTAYPTAAPSTSAPTEITLNPTTAQPTENTESPTIHPTDGPTTATPTSEPTHALFAGTPCYSVAFSIIIVGLFVFAV